MELENGGRCFKPPGKRKVRELFVTDGIDNSRRAHRPNQSLREETIPKTLLSSSRVLSAFLLVIVARLHIADRFRELQQRFVSFRDRETSPNKSFVEQHQFRIVEPVVDAFSSSSSWCPGHAGRQRWTCDGLSDINSGFGFWSRGLSLLLEFRSLVGFMSSSSSSPFAIV